MKVNAGDGFFESLKRLARYEAWHNRLWRALTRDLWTFLKNVWSFRRELWAHRWWDYSFTLLMLRRSLVIMEKGMHAGMEIPETREKKIEKMQRAIQILDNIIDSRYIGMAEAELGEIHYRELSFKLIEGSENLYELEDEDTPEEKEHNKKVYERSNELETAEWTELWKILEGQDYSKIDKNADWNSQFDGTGLKGWWD